MAITLLIIFYSPTIVNLPSGGSSVRFSGNIPTLALSAGAMLLGSLALASPAIIAPHVLSFLQATTIPVSLASKVPQIRELHRDKAPGQLSAIVVFAQLLGTIARV